MGQLTGIVTAGLQLGLESILIRPKRSIGPIEAMVWISEAHSDDLEITEHPVEYGARVADHAFLRPSEVTITCGWSNSKAAGAGGGLGGLVSGIASGLLQTVKGLSSLLSGNSQDSVKALYKALLVLQASRVPFQVLTGKRAYDNMLIKSLRTTTDANTENSLIVTCVCHQVLIVKTVVVSQQSAPPAAQKAPGITSPVKALGAKAMSLAPSANLGAIASAVQSNVGRAIGTALPSLPTLPSIPTIPKLPFP